MLTPYKEGPSQPGARSARAAQPLVVGCVRRPAVRRPHVAGQIYARNGSLDIAIDETEAAELQTLAHAHAARGVASRYLKGARREAARAGHRGRLRGRAAHACARLCEAPAVTGGALARVRVARRAGDARERRAHSADRDGAHRAHERAAALSAPTVVARRGQLGGADRHRRCGSAAGASGARPTALSEMARARAEPHRLGIAVLRGAVARRHAARGRDARGRRVRRACHRRRRPRSARRHLRARAARMAGRLSRRARGSAPRFARRAADHRAIGARAADWCTRRDIIGTACCSRRSRAIWWRASSAATRATPRCALVSPKRFGDY